MRAIVQRVLSAGVEVEDRLVSEIGPGLLVLVGIHESDTEADADYICRKVLNMRIFPNVKTGKGWDLSVKQCNYGVLLVSQFTLYGSLKGNKPDFHVAMPPQKAKPFYESLVEKFCKSYSSDAIKDPKEVGPWYAFLLSYISFHYSRLEHAARISDIFFRHSTSEKQSFMIPIHKEATPVSCSFSLSLQGKAAISRWNLNENCSDHVLLIWADGVFGAMMKVNLVNDGPVTIQLDSSQSSQSGASEVVENGEQ